MTDPLKIETISALQIGREVVLTFNEGIEGELRVCMPLKALKAALQARDILMVPPDKVVQRLLGSDK